MVSLLLFGCVVYLVSQLAHCRHVHRADETVLQGTSGSLLTLLCSKPFCLLLAHLTGLDLVEGVVRLGLESAQGTAGTTDTNSRCHANSHGQW